MDINKELLKELYEGLLSESEAKDMLPRTSTYQAGKDVSGYNFRAGSGSIEISL